MKDYSKAEIAFLTKMRKKGERFAKLLPKGYYLTAFNPGFLFASESNPRTIDIREDVVDSILRHVKR